MSLNCSENNVYFTKDRKKYDDEFRQKITQKLTEMRNVNDLDNIDCAFSEKGMMLDSNSISETEEEMEMWKYLSKLSIYLYNDYELFSQFIIKQNGFGNELFESEMKRLGYIRKGDAWSQKQKPEEEVIISNIFNYCFTRFIFNSNKKISTRESNRTGCLYCGTEIIDGKCAHCDESLYKFDTLGKKNLTDILDIISHENEMKLVFQKNKNKVDEYIKSNDKWVCGNCRLSNPISNQICEVCKTMNRNMGEGRVPELLEDTWLCRRCLTNNFFDKYRCSNCKKWADFYDKWVCEMCRFFNDKSVEKCGVCTNKNPNIVKCLQCKKKYINKNNICVDCLEERQLSPYRSGEIADTVKHGKEKDKVEIESKFSTDENIMRYSNPDKSHLIDIPGEHMCQNCRGKLTIYDQFWCKKCEDSRWFCPNRNCATINFLHKYCKKCKVEKDSDVSNYRNINVLKDNKPTQMWMCGLCKKYTLGTIHKCSHCKNKRYGMGDKVSLRMEKFAFPRKM